MAQLGFYYDASVCTGCKACEIACKDKNDLPIGVSFRRVHSFETGSFPNVRVYHQSLSCNHCANPACVRACATGATFVDEDGTVQFDNELCIGCGSCVSACPYGEPQLMPELNVARKCNSCKPLRDAGMNPVCVDACVMRAIEFGDLDELRKKHSGEKLSAELPYLPAPETEPSLLVHAKEAANAEKFKAMII